MKLGIITYHQAWNYGAALQCAALYKVLTSMGHHVRVIDYRPKYAQHSFVYQNPLIKAREGFGYARKKSFPVRLVSAAKWFAGGVLSYTSVKKRKRVYKKFNDFITQYVELTRLYSSVRELMNDPPALDCYICGSDQIWNPIATQGKLDEAYYLQFGSARKVSYAVSACKLNVREHEETLRRYLAAFDFVSLREADKLAEIRPLTKAPVVVSADPTLLLDPSSYADMEIPVPGLEEGKFTVAYFLGMNEPEAATCARNYVESGKWSDKRVVDISSEGVVPGAMRLEEIGPGEFVWLIRHAAFVMTNSFHAMVFSVLGCTPFVVLPRKGMNSRVEGLAAELNLEHRLIPQECLEQKDTKRLAHYEQSEIDWKSAYERLAALREGSLNIIRASMLEKNI